MSKKTALGLNKPAINANLELRQKEWLKKPKKDRAKKGR